MPAPAVLVARPWRRLLSVTGVIVGDVLLVAVVIVRFGVDPRPVALLLVWLACITPPLVAIDVRERRLPNRLVLPALGAAVPLTALDAAARGDALYAPLLLGLAVGAFLHACAVFGGLGMGDVKLGALLGLTVGCFGGSAVLMFAVVSVCSAGLVGAVVVLVVRLRGGSAGWRTRIPFGPFLLLGGWCAITGSG